MPKPDFSRDTAQLAARTKRLRALQAETEEHSQPSSSKEQTTVQLRPPLDKNAGISDHTELKELQPASIPSRHPDATIIPVTQWSRQMASLNTEVPVDLREQIDELYAKRRKLDRREGQRLTTYADLTREAFELLLRKQTPRSLRRSNGYQTTIFRLATPTTF